jgi:hypothetical protein
MCRKKIVTHNTIQTDIWTISLPPDWTERETSGSKSLYFEAADGTKGVYIGSWTLGDGDRRAAEDVAASFKDTDLKSLSRMNGFVWQVVSESSYGSGAACVAVTDYMASQNNYRSVGKILAVPPLVVRASFYDYACSDYNASRNYFSPIIDSLRLSGETLQ